jgi:hypothetical protein
MRVRYAKGTVFTPQGRMYSILKASEEYNLPEAIVKGIHQVCKDMLKIPLPFFGVKGIRLLARKMKRWPKKLGDKNASLYMGQVVRMLEEIGTGGAGFRFMYAAFLQEAALELKQPWLKDLSFEMTEAGDRWREFGMIAGRIFKNRAGQEDSYAAAADILLDIADREEKIFLKLRHIKVS